MEQDEYELFQKVFQVFRLQAFAPSASDQAAILEGGLLTGKATGVSACERSKVATGEERSEYKDDLYGVQAEHPELKKFLPNQTTRQHFRRAFVGPLYAPVLEISALLKSGQESVVTLSAKTEVSDKSLVDAVQCWKDRGNVCFRQREFSKAMSFYKEAVTELHTPNRWEEGKRLGTTQRKDLYTHIAACFSNLAQCQLRLLHFQDVVFATDEALGYLLKAAEEAGSKLGEARSPRTERRGSVLEKLERKPGASEFQDASSSALARKIWLRAAKAYEGLGQPDAARVAQAKAA